MYQSMFWLADSVFWRLSCLATGKPTSEIYSLNEYYNDGEDAKMENAYSWQDLMGESWDAVEALKGQ